MTSARRVLAAVFGRCVTASASVLTVVKFPDAVVQDTGARCIDGSPGGYFIERGSSNDTVIFLQGGGACWTGDDSVFSCWLRYNTTLGSSNYWPSTLTLTNNWFVRDCTANPIFCNFTYVYVPYCSGDVHAGQRTEVVNASLPFYFAGHRIVSTVLDSLLNTTGIAGAVNVLLSGSSAGGYGTFFNADYVASRLPGVGAVRAAPQAGWFFPHVVQWSAFVAGQLGPPYALDNVPIGIIWDAYLHPACMAAHNASFCTSVSNLYPFIATPLHVAENQADSNQIFMELGAPLVNNATVAAYIAYFRSTMTAAVAQVYAKNGGSDGLFFPNCLEHTADTTLQSTTTIGGVSYAQSVGAWWARQSNSPALHIADSCITANCNPTCPAGLGGAAQQQQLRGKATIGWPAAADASRHGRELAQLRLAVGGDASAWDLMG